LAIGGSFIGIFTNGGIGVPAYIFTFNTRIATSANKYKGYTKDQTPSHTRYHIVKVSFLLLLLSYLQPHSKKRPLFMKKFLIFE